MRGDIPFFLKCAFGVDAYEFQIVANVLMAGIAGRAIAAVTVDSHPDFDGKYFTQNGDTLEWFRRFIKPDGWR